MRAFTPTATTWPAAKAVQVSLTPTATAQRSSDNSSDDGAKTARALSTATVAGTPVTVGAPGALTKGLLPPTGAAKAATRADALVPVPSSPVSVRVAGHAASTKAGVRGFAVALGQVRFTRAPVAASRASVALDYKSIADAYGGDYASRLRLVELPACALTTPSVAACQAETPVAASANDLSAHKLVADIALPAVTDTSVGTVVLAADAAPSGGAGSYTATSLAPSGKWAGGGSTGAFTYDYPITVPPSVGGDAPKVALDYNSASVDGRTSATNNQASWVGDGWDYNPGFIERSYRSCSDDAPDDTTLKSDYDECWAGDNAAISLAGHSGDLVPTGTAGKWRLSDDDGSTVEELSGATNGLNSGTYWRLTTDDGTQYYFGADHLPTAAGGNGSDTGTNAAWGVPVYGNDSGEPCHASTFAASSCTQGWRWNLDFVVDPNQNITSYAYKVEQNYYGAGASHTLTAYTRGGYLSTISYGQRVPDYVAKANPGAVVTFGVMQRCDNTPSTGDCAAPTSSTSSHWPDVPFDQNCASTGTCKNYSPTFWSTMRLHTITTKVWDESLKTPGWSNVDTYTLNQTYPAIAGDGAKPSMWLASVTHTGSDTRGGDTTAPNTLPALTLTGQATLPNRVDGLEEPQDISPLYRYRLQSLTTETGENITVKYRQDTCSRTSPPSETADTSLCYPVRWTPPGYEDPILDWFYIYPVAEVDQTDNKVTASPAQVTRYTYSGPAWHRDDSEFTTTKTRTYGDFRGFSEVTTRTGKSSDPITKSVTDYLQGMGGSVKDLAGDTLTDDNALSGFAYQTTVYDKDGGTPQTETVNHPWLSKATATHSRGSSLPDLTAHFVNTDRTDTRQLKADGSWRTAETVATFDTSTGLPTTVDDKGEVDSNGTPVSASTTPEKCVSATYASDSARNMMAYPDQVITEAGACVTGPDAHTLAADRVWYDGATAGSALGAVSGAGNPTATQQAKSSTGSTITWAAPSKATYDAYGRITGTVDPLGRTTGTAYGTSDAAAKYLPFTTVATNAMGWKSTTTLDPGRGLPLTVTDFNGRLTTETYDGLGRLTKVWLPDHTQAANSSTPNDKYSYTVSATVPSAVETQSLLNGGNYGIDYKIYDSLLHLRQEQSSPQDGGTGRLITDTAYDSHGWTTSTDAAFYNKDSNPTGSLVNPTADQVPSSTRTTFDGQGRPIASYLYSLGTQQWSTTTSYPGADETDITPPTGGTPTASLTDVRGQTTELRQFHGATATGSYDKTDYAYDAAGHATKDIGPLTSDTDPASSPAQAVTWTKSYDLLGNVTQQTDPDTGTINSTYDDDSEVTQAIDGRPDRAGEIDTAYDALGRVTNTSGWDATTNKSVPLTSRTYDNVVKGQPTSVTAYENGKATYTTTVTGYTTNYQPSGTTTSIPAGAYGNTAAITYSTTNTYTELQDLLDTSKISTSGTGSLLPDETLYYSHNGMGLPVGVGGTDDYTGWIDYTPLGQVERTTQGLEPKQVVTTDNWDMATGRLLSYANDREEDTDGTAATTAVDNVSYTYNPAGQITSTSDVQDTGGTANTDTQCYTYDYLARLTQAWSDTGATHTADAPTVPGIGGCDHTTSTAANLGGPAPYWESYTYDLTGNRTSKTVHDTTGDAAKNATTNEVYDTTDHTHAVHTTTTGDTTQTYTYDADGNPTNIATTTGGQAQPDQAQNLTWDTQGDLTSLTSGPASAPTHTTDYHYDADGNLTARTDDGTTTVYLGSDELTINKAGTVTAANRSYNVAGAPTTIRSATTGSTGSTLDYQLPDPQGTSTTDISADSLTVTRRAYTPFGETRTATPTTWPGDKGYVGGTADLATGLTNLGAREYNPTLGRFLNPDPLRTITDPQQWNGYAYSDNNPVNSSDSTGQMLDGDGAGDGVTRTSGGSTGASAGDEVTEESTDNLTGVKLEKITDRVRASLVSEGARRTYVQAMKIVQSYMDKGWFRKKKANFYVTMAGVNTEDENGQEVVTARVVMFVNGNFDMRLKENQQIVEELKDLKVPLFQGPKGTHSEYAAKELKRNADVQRSDLGGDLGEVYNDFSTNKFCSIECENYAQYYKGESELKSKRESHGWIGNVEFDDRFVNEQRARLGKTSSEMSALDLAVELWDEGLVGGRVPDAGGAGGGLENEEME
ncbi:RHS repeat-associated core domain-containing protein [Actinacidiphila sp. bgisy144]|uniref:RHS repeat domain-containing protein n=1 Tax=unclassified Actinacidiphila TaxID=2995708 RepID=UPI003EB832E1